MVRPKTYSLTIAAALLLAAFLASPLNIAAQEQTASVTPAPFSRETPPQLRVNAQTPVKRPGTHKEFWDETNILLVSGVAAARGLDYASTLQFRTRGRKELLLNNSIVDNKPLFLSVEVAAAAASVGVSYWLHRSGHHRLERLISIAHIAAGIGGAIHNYELAAPVRH